MPTRSDRLPPEDTLALLIAGRGLPQPVRQHRFHPKRRWRFDFAWPDAKVAVEVDGGTWTGGRHTRPQGFAKDCEKLDEAVILGWRVLRFTTEQVQSGYALDAIERMMTEVDHADGGG